ncbi:MAG: hypothetical protein KA339_03425 [Candidatus Kapabacteria bacterium]|nr:hypothetical protein [Ignavibacteria bacterium]MBP6509581.1 hypothetical protein [Candidatus Kapabacteria bacterium]MBK6420234.1 hypothetical protein [Ignavibacteria bacterium]MBK6759132.1 hypothetical protein [Ignavibacteria bacterium]MBK7412816.1 hypothetical protein [Ignavibacteria bacterium]
MTLPQIHPEIEEIRSQYQTVRSDLRAAVEEWHRLSNEVRPRLNATYQHYFGELERELQFKALEGAELFRRVELLSIKIARGERLTPEIIDLVNQVVDKEYAKFNRRLREAFDMDVQQRERAAQQRVDIHDDEELVMMYRTLVKKLHPDAVGANAPGSEEWHRVQNAYRDRNVSQLRSLLAVLGVNETEDHITDTWDIERWKAELDILEKRLQIEERKLNRLRRQDPFVIESELDDEAWRTRHTKELQDAVSEKEKEIAENREHYREITGGEVPQGTDVVKSKEDQTFDEDFMKNTYFGQR